MDKIIKERIKDALIYIFVLLWCALGAYGIYYEWVNDCVPEDWPTFL